MFGDMGSTNLQNTFFGLLISEYALGNLCKKTPDSGANPNPG
jgi:hypothetical protein